MPGGLGAQLLGWFFGGVGFGTALLGVWLVARSPRRGLACGVGGVGGPWRPAAGRAAWQMWCRGRAVPRRTSLNRQGHGVGACLAGPCRREGVGQPPRPCSWSRRLARHDQAGLVTVITRWSCWPLYCLRALWALASARVPRRGSARRGALLAEAGGRAMPAPTSGAAPAAIRAAPFGATSTSGRGR